MGKLIDANAMYKRYCVDKEGLDVIYDATDLPDMLASMPPIDAIPVEWLRKVRNDERLTLDDVETIDMLLTWWQKEQEAR